MFMFEIWREKLPQGVNAGVLPTILWSIMSARSLLILLILLGAVVLKLWGGPVEALQEGCI